MKSYKIGIAIPNYNNSKYLEDCIESIIGQTYKDIEILVVDDCSTDNSVEILESLSKKYTNVSFLVNEKNRGVSYTRDRAIRALNTDYISSIDSDDFYFSSKKLENEMNLIKKYRDQGQDIVAYSNIISTDEQGNFQKRNITKNNFCNGQCFEKFITRSSRIPTCSVYLKTYYLEVNGFDHDISMYEDWDLEIRLSKIIKFYYTDEDGFAYRHHNYGLSSAKKEEHKKWLNYVFDKNTKDLQIEERDKLYRIFQNKTNPSVLSRIVRRIKRIIKK